MSLDTLLRDYEQRFPKSGAFELRRGESLRKRAVAEGLPDEPGVYLIYGRRNEVWELLYIGRSGTLHNDGSFGSQKLLKRITKGKQEGVRRPRFFRERMALLGIEALRFRWFVTFADGNGVIPAKAEADLLQAYLGEHSRLPPWNKSV